MEYSYYLIYAERRGGGEISFNVGSREEASALIRTGGRRVPELFDGMMGILSRAGCIVPLQTGNPKIYAVRDDAGPVVGAYLILVKRAQKIDYWVKFLEELLVGEHARLGRAFSSFLDLAIELSKASPPGRGYSLSPRVVTALSSALKVFVKSLRGQS